MKVAIGIAIVAIHLLAFVAFAGRSAGHELEVDVRTGTVPDELAGRVVETTDGDGPGLRREHWRVAYRGGFVREVGATRLVGPFQDPAAPPCSGRVVVGQALLDQIAVAMRKLLDQQMQGEEVFPIGKYKSIEAFTLEWARFESHPLDATLLGTAGAPHGYVRATARVLFDRVVVPLVLVAVPEQVDTQLHFRVQAYARVEVSNSVVQWLNAKVDVTSALATKIANHEIAAMLVTALAPPPPFELDKDQTLTFTFCRDPVEVIDHQLGALPFAVLLGRAAVAPPLFAPAANRPATKTLAIDLDVNALNAILYELWRTGWLDKRLAEVGLDRRFNTDPTVTEFLTVRLSPLRLALPPVIEPAGDHLRLAADARVDLADGGTTIGRVYGGLDFHFTDKLGVATHVGALELACERTPTTLVPCYADLVAAVADRGADFDGALTTAFGKLLADIFVGRSVSAGDLPGELAIHGVVPSLTPGARGIHLELDAKLVE